MHRQMLQFCQAELAAQPQKWPSELGHSPTAAGATASRRQGAAGLHQPPAAPQLADVQAKQGRAKGTTLFHAQEGLEACRAALTCANTHRHIRVQCLYPKPNHACLKEHVSQSHRPYNSINRLPPKLLCFLHLNCHHSSNLAL